MLTQPTGQTCTVSSGSGTANANVITVAVSCKVNTYTIGGTITGVNGGGTVTIQDNGGDNLSQGNGNFTFATALNSGAAYKVTVRAQQGQWRRARRLQLQHNDGRIPAQEQRARHERKLRGLGQRPLSLAPGTLHITGAGQGAVLTYTPADNGGDSTLIPVPAVANTLVGAFNTLGFPVSLVIFGNDAHYLIAEVSGDPAGAGVEYGCYTTQAGPPTTLTVDLNTTTCPVAVDTNSDAPYIFVLGGTLVGIRSLPN